MITRRQFCGLLAVPALAGLYSWRIEPTWEEYVRRQMPIRGLPLAWAGRTLLQLSDLHVGDRVSDDYLVRVFATVARLRPDLVAYTGDFISYAGPRTLEQFRRLADRLPRGRSGTVAVLGNHDYGAAWREGEVADAVALILAEVGVVVLRNTAVAVQGLRIGGMDDLWAGRAHGGDWLTGANAPALVLCHNPDACDQSGWDGFSGWILAGHTHGGQCRPPFLPPPLLPVKNRRYTAGEFALSGGRKLYINRGLGHLTRVRFNVRPEVTIFELRGR
ncbi:putative metallophosphoesterase [Lacunisphaera limnophila]|uniref:Putative metallophosphoesterase n=1 Tax=Lacunisphaera limnophila TaxID=1838286 RepID=A0A1D8ARH9_9BACT|nr:metallophosphoesterase [Lacunisphaera limnophila]AOS43486.1 putative metallophosphoesterase [Lacunisphaera limnophila]